VYPRTVSILEGFGKRREGIAKDYLATNGRNLIGVAAIGEARLPAPMECIYTTKTPPLSVEDWFSSTDKYDLLFGRSA
jgi:hypothetical protein